MFYIVFVFLKVKRTLRAKSVTQCPRVSCCDRCVLYGELNYYLGCQTPEFHLYPRRHICLSRVIKQISHELQQIQ